MIVKAPASILITGGSSGIGAALAAAYAGPGASLALGGRDAERLDATAEICRGLGAEVSCARLDVADRDPLADWIASVDRLTPLDLVIANAGVSAGTSGVPGARGLYGESEAQARRIFQINLEGVLNTVHAAIPLMRARGRGQIALMSSLAGFRGLPGAPAYSASKAAIKSYGEALRPTLKPHGVGVTVICPGFVDSRITELNDHPMPFKMEAAAAARLIKRRLERNPARIAFPWPLYGLVSLFAALPAALTDGVFARRAQRG